MKYDPYAYAKQQQAYHEGLALEYEMWGNTVLHRLFAWYHRRRGVWYMERVERYGATRQN